MRILVHICCGPCGITVLQRLLEEGHTPTGFFFNPNIHPLAEYMRRREGALQTAQRLGVPLLMADTLPEAEQVWSDPWLEPAPAPALEPDGTQAALPFVPGGGQEPQPLVPGQEPLPFVPGGTQAPLPPAVNPVPWLRAVAGREGERCLFCWRSRLAACAAMALKRGFAGFTSSLLYSRYQDHDRIRALGRDIAAAGGPEFVYRDFRVSWQQGIALSKEWGIYRQQYCGCLYSEYERYSRPFARLREDG